MPILGVIMLTKQPIAYVTGIRKPHKFSTVDHITHCRVKTDTGNESIRPVDTIISLIKTGNFRFLVRIGAVETEVRVVYGEHNRAYIRTSPDHSLADNLLSLPEC